ncbi:cytochrome P450 [Periconia macrospinosa]|uniref:Cytochrome P450 n=1 Tax=Periconia macrospinosa TaxID=97972 RepID=A0A2V1DC72_9PLEO|nr:cytochrome P450 [Periconia macrospinosa]
MLRIIITSIALGFLVHHGFFIRGEWHLAAPRVILAHLVIIPAFFSWQLYRDEDYKLGKLVSVAIAASTYVFGLFLSIVIYRLYFHRLKKFPGPRLAGVSKLWHVWQCRSSRGHHVLEQLYKEYGPFVRTGPNEITIFHPAVYDAMDGPKNRNTRSDWYDLLYPRVSSIFTRDAKTHDLRRKVWDNAFHQVALSNYYKGLTKHVRRLERILDEGSGKPFVVNDILYRFSFDSMGDFGFSEDFKSLESGNCNSAQNNLSSAISLLGPFSPAIWIPRIAFAFIPGVWKVRDWFQMLEDADSLMNSRMKKKKAGKDISHFFIEAYKSGQKTQVTRQLLSGDTVTLLVAGSDSTAPSLIVLLYFLARYPKHAEKIRHELEGVDITDVKALSGLHHLTGTINESMRLLPAILSFSSRVTPPEGLMIDNTYIPGNTKICAPRYSIGRMASAYTSPHEFLPERWYSQPELIKDKRAFAPFGLGRTSCVGKHLAMAQMRLVAASILTNFHVRFVCTEEEMTVERDMLDQLTAKPGKLRLIFEKRC